MEKEVFITDDGLVLKMIHEDGSETSIKTVSSCDTIRNPKTGIIEYNNIERNKYSIFASSSRGCPMRCTFCYLTIKYCEYGKLTEDQILSNLKEALLEQLEHKPETKDRFVKLCWMGMGEDQIIQSSRTRSITNKFLSWVFDNNYAVGLDGVDISTVLPNIKREDWIDNFHRMNVDIWHNQYSMNPNNKIRVHGEGFSGDEVYIDRSAVRLFYSLHSGNQETRDKIIPNAMPLARAIPLLKEYSLYNSRNVIFHHMFMEGQNDSEKEVDDLLRLIDDNELHNYEFRILRYNHCQNSPFGESDTFNNIIDRIADRIQHIKVQISTGNEVRAACGQFIVKKFVDV